MKHSHSHPHADGTVHSHWHEHDGDWPGADLWPHEHEHRTRQLTIPVTFEIGGIEDFGLAGFKVSWLDAEQDGRQYSLTAGAGVGSPYLEALVTGGGQPGAYAQADIRPLAWALFDALRQAQDDAAVLAAEEHHD